MRYLLLLLIVVVFVVVPHFAYGEQVTNELMKKWVTDTISSKYVGNEEIKDSILNYNLSSLWTKTKSSQIFGFIGDNYQRIQIHISSVTKDPTVPALYHVRGKTKVKGNIC